MRGSIEYGGQRSAPPNASGEAALHLLTAAGRLQQRLGCVCDRFGITHDQYGVLLILRAAHPKGLARHELAARLLERAPDVTRLTDRLERNGLVERYRSADDRRLSITRISRMGLVLLEQMEEPIGAARDGLLSALATHELAELARLCNSLHRAA